MTEKAKDCGNHGGKHKRKRSHVIFACLLLFIIVILFIIFVIWLVLRPTKPRFVLQDATVFNFTVAAPNILNTVMQVTIYSRNRMDRVGIYYGHLDVFASYRSQQITLNTVIQPSYQGHNDVTVWSPFLYGANVPVSTYLTSALSGDQNVGFIPLSIRIDGRLRWKVGTWTSRNYRLHVNCPAFLSYNPAGAIRLQQPVLCSVDV
ncbi:hypothetical protein ACLOJK_020829 [Asimina triloba]